MAGKSHRLPVQQLVILSICRIAEPIALTSVFPYLYFMIRAFGVDEKDIAFYVGITGASFSLSQFFTGVLWGRWSDRIGRKPTILLGFCGTMFAFIAFGLSQNLAWAIIARSSAGLLNGNVGIIRTMVAEMVPQKELQPRAFSIMPLVWSIGTIIGPVIGGLLSEPVQQHPKWFNKGSPVTTLFLRFPFLLPNLFVALFLSVGLITGFFFLEETMETRKHQRDVGITLGQKLFKCCLSEKQRRHRRLRKASHDFEEAAPFLPEDEQAAELDVDGALPNNPINRNVSRSSRAQLPPPTFREVLNKQSQLQIVLYTLLALHSVAYDQILPVFMGSRRLEEGSGHVKLPFQFSGGFAWNTSEIGSIFGIYGFVSMGLQFFIFPPVTKWLGPKKAFTMVGFLYPLVYMATPYLVFVPLSFQRWCTLVIMCLKSICIVFAFPCLTIMLTNSATSLRTLGTLNGIAVALSSLGRAFGPAMSGILYTWGMKANVGVITWFFLASVAIIGLLPLPLVVEGDGFASEEGELEEEDRVKLSSNQRDSLDRHLNTSLQTDILDGNEDLDEVTGVQLKRVLSAEPDVENSLAAARAIKSRSRRPSEEQVQDVDRVNQTETSEAADSGRRR